MINRILTFGTFDGVHDGHRAMLRQAKLVASRQSTVSQEKQNYLIVAVAPDSVVLDLKGSPPKFNAGQRIALLKTEHLADEVVLGDTEQSSWKILKKYKPSIIALGYDQDELRQNLEEYLEKAYPEVETAEGDPPEDEGGRASWQKNPKRPKIVMLSPHKPDVYKSSLMK